MNLMAVREAISRSSKKGSFYSFTEKLIKDMLEANLVGNARVYRHTLSAVKNFTKERVFTFEELNL